MDFAGGIMAVPAVTINWPVICVGWMSHLKKYVPGVAGAVKV